MSVFLPSAAHRGLGSGSGRAGWLRGLSLGVRRRGLGSGLGRAGWLRGLSLGFRRRGLVR